MSGRLSHNYGYRSLMYLNGCHNTETNHLNNQSLNNIEKDCSGCLDNTSNKQIKGKKYTIDAEYSPHCAGRANC